jgi:hypothetical protein
MVDCFSVVSEVPSRRRLVVKRKIVVGVILCLSLGLNVALLVLLLPQGGNDVVYAGGTPSGNGNGNGDVNASGTIDIADAIYLLTYLFAKGPVPEPIESADGGLAATGQTTCYARTGP